MKTVKISLNSIDKVKNFVNDISKFDVDFDLVSGRYVIDAKSIMEKMNITHKPTLKHFVLKLISQDRQFYDVKGLYLKSSARPYVNKKGEVRINVNKLDLGSLDVNEGDEFAVTVEDNRIILTVI